MKIISWTDNNGYMRNALIGDDDDESLAAEIGAPQDPPDLDLIDWDKVKMRLHNGLVVRGIFTNEDARRNPEAVTSAILAAVRNELKQIYNEYGG